jgi:hypothetical protein
VRHERISTPRTEDRAAGKRVASLELYRCAAVRVSRSTAHRKERRLGQRHRGSRTDQTAAAASLCDGFRDHGGRTSRRALRDAFLPLVNEIELRERHYRAAASAGRGRRAVRRRASASVRKRVRKRSGHGAAAFYTDARIISSLN